jgi:hypothetical protein
LLPFPHLYQRLVFFLRARPVLTSMSPFAHSNAQPFHANTLRAHGRARTTLTHTRTQHHPPPNHPPVLALAPCRRFMPVNNLLILTHTRTRTPLPFR